MPILKIPIDGEDSEFKILPLNKTIQLSILKRNSEIPRREITMRIARIISWHG